MAGLRFVNSRTVNAGNLAELPKPFLLQMARAATLGFGAAFTTALEFLQQCGHGELATGHVELWDVVEDSAPDHALFQVWCYDGDTAIVFIAGTQQDAGVSMSEATFERHGTPGTDALAEVLQTAFDALNSN